MITLSKATEIHTRLQAAWMRFSGGDDLADVDRRRSGHGEFDPNEPPLVLVVSSMAGGAGASMALDVPAADPRVGPGPETMGVFMVTPDIFDSLPQVPSSGCAPIRWPCW